MEPYKTSPLLAQTFALAFVVYGTPVVVAGYLAHRVLKAAYSR